MLIQFSVKNWRSIKDQQTLSMVMATGKEMCETNTFLPTTPSASELLRSVAIYGANAAGKSNLLKALEIMQEIVVESAKGQHGEPLPMVPFVLDSDTEQAPSEFEVIFIAEGIRYQYGFAANTQRITEEWLLAFPLGRARKWFAREWDAQKNEYVWDKGASLAGPKQLWQDSTRQNALFLSTAVQLNSLQLQPIYNWFSKTLRLTNVSGWAPTFTASLCKERAQREQVLDFLKAADLDIHDVIVEPEKLTAKHLPADMPEDIKSKVLIDHKDQLVYDIKTVHQSKQGRSINFAFDDESDGTRKFFGFAGPWLDSLKNGYVLCIDELHDNLHPKMVQFLVSLFHNNETNPNNAQLIFTTHETSILNQDVFRRDQIWFCEKSTDQATKVFPLTDFNPRKGRENLEANYLAGRYGALPYVRSLKLAKSA
jgi:AAA15 family ATPase/GTPase